MSIRLFRFSKGMNDAVDPINLMGDPSEPIDFASLIENYVPDGEGYLTPIKALEAETSSVFTINIKRLFAWRCANLYEYSTGNFTYDSNYYVALKAIGKLYLFYRTDITTWAEVEISSIIFDTDKFRAVSTSTEFLVVDGFFENSGQRITVDADGVLSCNPIGFDGGGLIGEVVGGTASSEVNVNSGMQIPAGVLVQVVHADLNEFGELSNPYPITTLPTTSGLWEGEINGDDKYVRTGVLGGSFLSLSLTLPVSEKAVKKYVYYRWSPYSEGYVPATPFLLGGIFDVIKGSDTITVTLARPASTAEPSYNNNNGGSANDVIVPNGIKVYGNMSTEVNMPVVSDDVWEIRIPNPNSSNYTDGLFKIDLWDDGYAPTTDAENILEGIDWDTENIDNLRLVYSDRITPLIFKHYPVNSPYTYHKKDGSTDTVNTRKLVIITIPYIPAYSEITIFLVRNTGGFAGTDWADYGGIAVDPTSDIEEDVSFYKLTRPESPDSAVAYNNWAGNIIPVSAVSNLATLHKSFTASDKDITKIIISPVTDALFFMYDPTVVNQTTLKTNTSTGFMQYISALDTILEWKNDTFLMPTSGRASLWYYSPHLEGTNNHVLDLSHRVDYDIRVVVTWDIGTVTFKIEARYDSSYDYSDPITLTQNIGTGYDNDDNYFIYLTWNSVNGDEGYTDINLTVVHFRVTDTGTMEYEFGTETLHTTNIIIDQKKRDRCHYYVSGGVSNLSIEHNKWTALPDKYWMARILAKMQMLPDFDVEPIGVSDAEDDMTSNAHGDCVLNKNVQFKALNTNQVNRHGIVKFGVNTIPNLNEVELNDEILRLAYLKTESGAGMQSSVFAFARNRVYQISISPDQATWQQLVLLEGIGLSNADALVMFENSIMWMSDKGLYMLDSSGIHPFSTGRIKESINFNRLCWSILNKRLYMLDYNYTSPNTETYEGDASYIGYSADTTDPIDDPALSKVAVFMSEGIGHEHEGYCSIWNDTTDTYSFVQAVELDQPEIDDTNPSFSAVKLADISDYLQTGSSLGTYTGCVGKSWTIIIRLDGTYTDGAIFTLYGGTKFWHIGTWGGKFYITDRSHDFTSSGNVHTGDVLRISFSGTTLTVQINNNTAETHDVTGWNMPTGSSITIGSSAFSSFTGYLGNISFFMVCSAVVSMNAGLLMYIQTHSA